MASKDPEKGVPVEEAFPVSLEVLCDFMKERNGETLAKISDPYGGVLGLARKLGVDPSKGLITSQTEDFGKREQQYGSNVIPPKKPKSFLQLCWEACQDLTLIILICASIFSLVLALVVPHDKEKDDADKSSKTVEWIEGLAIMIAVCIVVLVTAGNDWSKERKFRGLQERISKEQHVDALRDGEINPLNVTDILVGDIVHVKYGDQVPADGLIIQCNDLKIDESSMTGESDLIKKSVDKCPWLLAGTHVMEGSGRMLTVAVGKNSQTGIIFTLLGASGGEGSQQDQPTPNDTQASKDKANGVPKVEIVPPGLATENGSNQQQKRDNVVTETDVDGPLPTPNSKEHDGDSDSEGEGGGEGVNQDKSVLQTKLTKLTILIGKLGTAAAVLTVLVLVVRFIINELLNGRMPAWSWLNEFVGHIIIGVTVLVVAVPEGLPLAVTISLAYSVKKMMKDNNLVRHLDACETMGSATTICSDKTGTLTKNRMTVTQIYAQKQHHKDIPNTFKPSHDYLDLLAHAISINSGYTSQIIEEHPGDKHAKHVGNKTECGLLGLLMQMGATSYHTIREKNPEDSFLKVYTFNSARKSMSTVIQLADGTKRLFTKGASETILKLCSFQLGENGSAEPMTKKDTEAIIKTVVEPMASDALRTLCIAYKDFPADVDLNYDDEVGLISQLTCIAITGIEDPVRDEVPEAIAKCQRAGITVRMVTGDNIMTARSIASKCGIIKPGDEYLVIEGREFNKRIRNKDGLIEQKRLDQVWPQLRVLARSSPTDKHTLVKGIIDSELPGASEVVAVTGDGTNDGPALKKADVGFAMGIAGTDVAKEASDIILTDDNFTSIVKAVMWGRNVYDSIAKFLQFQLTVNLVAIILAFTSSCIIMSSPLKAIQLLWVNLIMDTFASLALATEMPTEDLLNRKPYGRTKPLISPMMARNIVGHAIYQLVVLYTILFAGPMFLPLEDDGDFARKAKVPNDHFTMVFNVFVLMQCFNEINARKIHGERNVFKGIFTNALFVSIVIGTIIAQVLIVEFGSVITFTTPLSWDLWLWSVALGMGTLVWGQVLNCIPADKLPASFSWGESTEDYSNKPLSSGNANAASAETQDLDPEYSGDGTGTGVGDVTVNMGGGLGGTGGVVGGVGDNRSRVLWVRGVTRIQQQMRVVKAFRETVQPMRSMSRDTTYHDFMHKPVPVMGTAALMGYHFHYQESPSGTSTPTTPNPSTQQTPHMLGSHLNTRHSQEPPTTPIMIDEQPPDYDVAAEINNDTSV
ncbi:LOW QUALITY PROTEIN: plasma membrane calcium-transporting ATPase 2-like [Convolutriloba macropyga]|uniref:LOW QUALITY PROTEIN: plasma membrane calcium-transporting ATPase 2-like n=1 Tax=Convolutriloba macropyga TaxID=536237 RepID=UPI003F528FD3